MPQGAKDHAWLFIAQVAVINGEACPSRLTDWNRATTGPVSGEASSDNPLLTNPFPG